MITLEQEDTAREVAYALGIDDTEAFVVYCDHNNITESFADHFEAFKQSFVIEADMEDFARVYINQQNVPQIIRRSVDIDKLIRYLEDEEGYWESMGYVFKTL